uniref:Uncharacterized protein n=1 Tax=Timema poppense TaxID=170557 RepID=A0A7R9HJK3_TIMPO|nr:unnamed protein product [Timema poppensis]
MRYGGNREPCVLENIKYVPSLGTNVFSTGTATSRGFMMVERECIYEIQYSDGTIVVIGGKDSANQYRLGPRIYSSPTASLVLTDSSQLTSYSQNLVSTKGTTGLLYSEVVVNVTTVTTLQRWHQSLGI